MRLFGKIVLYALNNVFTLFFVFLSITMQGSCYTLASVLEEEFGDAVRVVCRRDHGAPGRFDVMIMPENILVRRGIVTTGKQMQEVVNQIRSYIDGKK